jgi:hypothetical protein
LAAVDLEDPNIQIGIAAAVAVAIAGAITTYFVYFAPKAKGGGGTSPPILQTVAYEVWDKTTGGDVKVADAGTGSERIVVYIGDSIVSKQASGTSTTPGSTVALYWNGSVAASTTANDAGYWEVDGTITSDQVGTNTAKVIVTPPSGNAMESDTITFEVNAYGGGTKVTGTAT